MYLFQKKFQVKVFLFKKFVFSRLIDLSFTLQNSYVKKLKQNKNVEVISFDCFYTSYSY